MILPSFVLSSRCNVTESTSGMDTIDKCCDPVHWKQYPYPVVYQYNSRGYRDHEWPDDLARAVWCFGDSFTLGIGLPGDQTWPSLLGNLLQQRTLNISLDGASNQWILRKIQELLPIVVPKTIVIQWTFTHRRELSQSDLMDIEANRCRSEWDDLYNAIKDPSWPIVSLDEFYELPTWIIDEIKLTHLKNDYRLDQWLLAIDPAQWYLFDEDRRRQHSHSTHDQDAADLINCVDTVEQLAAHYGICVIHSFIPFFSHSTTADTSATRFKTICNRTIVPFKPQDLARDGFHYGVITSKWVSQQMFELVKSAHARI